MGKGAIDEDRLFDLLHKMRLSESELKEIGQMSSLKELEFWPKAKFAAGALRHLCNLKGLRMLTLVKSNVKDADLASIGKIKSLRQLTLDDCSIHDSGLKHLASLAGLEELSLSSTKITDKGLAYLGGITKLQWLCLSGTKITDSGLAHLFGLSRLEHLDLEKTKVTKQGMSRLSGLPKFEKIIAGFKQWKVSKRELQEMRCDQITEQDTLTVADMEEIAQAGFVNWLTFERKNSKFAVGAFAPLKKLKNLKCIAIKDSTLTDDHMADISACGNLQHLRLNGCSVTDTGAGHLARLSKLEDLWLERSKITDKGLAHIGKITKLKYLYLDQTQFTDKGLVHLANLSELSVLCISRTKVTNDGIVSLAGLRKLSIVAKGTKVTKKGMDDFLNAQREARRAPKAKAKAAATVKADVKEIEAAKAVLYGFFAAMSKWEGKMKRRPKRESAEKAFMNEQKKALEKIYQEFVTRRKRPWGRLASMYWREPATYYKPEKMKIIDIERPTASKVIFYTNEWPDLFRQQFVMIKKADRWYVDNRKVFLEGWEAEGL